MALEICKKHPGRTAIGHCETCHVPVCEQCAVAYPGTDKVFCSQEHAERFMSYTERRKEVDIARKRPKSIVFLLPKWILILAVVAAIACAVLWFAVGVPPGDQIGWIRDKIGF